MDKDTQHCDMPNDRELLTRIDERVNAIHAVLPTLITRSEFAPVKALVYGATGLICVAVLTALVGVVVAK